MSTYVDFLVSCPCGHTGIIHLHEGDGPSLWEDYTLENLDGQSFSSDTPVDVPEMLRETEATCPKCKKAINKSMVGDAYPA